MRPVPVNVGTIALAIAVVTLAGCGGMKVSITDRSAVEQELVVRALDRAVAGLEIEPYLGPRVVVDLFTLSKDQAFAREFLVARLQERGVRVTTDSTAADVRLKVFATILGTDHGETLLGIPAFTAPVVNASIPEIAIFKWVRDRGRAEVQVLAFDSRTDQFLGRIPDSVGGAKFDSFTVLILVSFSVSDLDERPDPAPPR